MTSQSKRLQMQIELKEIPESSEQEDNADEWRTGREHSSRLFTVTREVVLFCLMVFYVADIVLDVWVAVRLFDGGNPKSAWFVVFCILLPNLYAGYKSLQWYLRSHDDDPLTNPLIWMVRVLFFPVSVLLRYFDAWHFGRLSKVAWSNHDRQKERNLFTSYLIESIEVSTLRLFIIFLEDAPIAVLNLKEVLLTPPATQKYTMAMCSVVLAKLFLTMTLGVVHFTNSTKAFYHSARKGQCYFKGHQLLEKTSSIERGDMGLLSLPAECCVYVWHLFSIASRLVSYAMFVSVYQRYVWILIVIRWTIHTAWIKYDVHEISFGNCLAFGGVYLFSFVPTAPNRQINRIILYYIINFSENISTAILWHYAAPASPYAAGAYGIVFGGDLGGIFFMCLYYGCFHPARKETYLYNFFKERRNGRIVDT